LCDLQTRQQCVDPAVEVGPNSWAFSFCWNFECWDPMSYTDVSAYSIQ
jgi:hypothetical protein